MQSLKGCLRFCRYSYLKHGSLHELDEPLPVGGPASSGVLPAGLYLHLFQATSFPPKNGNDCEHEQC
jgi:hypothetical protein